MSGGLTKKTFEDLANPNSNYDDEQKRQIQEFKDSMFEELIDKCLHELAKYPAGKPPSHIHVLLREITVWPPRGKPPAGVTAPEGIVVLNVGTTHGNLPCI